VGTQTDDDVRRWQIAVTGGFFDADLEFDAGFDLAMHETQVLLSVAYRATADLTVGLRAGAVVDGELRSGDRTWEVRPGAVVALQADYRFLAEPVTLSGGLALAGSFTSTREIGSGREDSLTALDLRLSVTVSKTIEGVFTPYFSARAFGGPVMWTFQDGDVVSDVVGSDPGHHQLAIGASVAPVPGLSASIEWAFLGETALYGSLAVAF